MLASTSFAFAMQGPAKKELASKDGRYELTIHADGKVYLYDTVSGVFEEMIPISYGPRKY